MVTDCPFCGSGRLHGEAKEHPDPVMRLVEVIGTESSDPAYVAAVTELVRDIGKIKATNLSAHHTRKGLNHVKDVLALANATPLTCAHGGGLKMSDDQRQSTRVDGG
jgi:hypothetical protein